MRNAYARVTLGALAAVVGVGIAAAPIAAASPDPLVPFGPGPHASVQTGQHFSNHDEANQSGGFVDTPF